MHDKTNILRAMPAVFFLQFVQWSTENVFFVSTPNIATAFTITPATASWIISISGFTFGIGSGVYAVLADIVGMRKLFVWGTIIFVIGSLLGFASSQVYWLVILSRFIQTSGSAVVTGCLFVLIIRYVPVSHKAKCFGYSAAIFQLATACGSLAGGFIATHFSWQYVFLFPLSTLICLPAFLKYLPNEASRTKTLDIRGAILLAITIVAYMLAISWLNIYYLLLAIGFTFVLIKYLGYQEKKSRAVFISLLVFKNTKFLFCLLIGLLVLGAQVGIFFSLPFLVTQLYHLPTSVVGEMYLLANLFSFFVGVFAGYLVGKIGNNKGVYLGLSISFVGVLILASSLGKSIYLLYFGLVLFGCGYPLFITGFMSYFATILSEKLVGTSMAVYNIFTNLLAVFVPTILGLVITLKLLGFRWLPVMTGTTETYNYYNILLVFCVLLATGMLIFKQLYKRSETD